MTSLNNLKAMTKVSSIKNNVWLSSANKKLKEAGIESYSLDSLLLLEFVTKLNRAHLLAHQDEELKSEQIEKLDNLLVERVKRTPLAYIMGKKEFYGRSFYVNENVLIPRPESESFIELLKKHDINAGKLIDVGCGSGILGITAKLENPKLEVTLSDISKPALEVAKQNAKDLGAEVKTKLQDLFNEYYDVVLANLPYVPRDLQVEKELSYEPQIALFAENKGLKIYKDFCKKVAKIKPQYVLTESLVTQHKKLDAMMNDASYQLKDTDNLVQLYELAG